MASSFCILELHGTALVTPIDFAAMFLCIVCDGSCSVVFFFLFSFVQGYFLLRFLASQVGEQQFLDFFRLFVKKYHGQLILSQVRLWYRKLIFT